MSNTLRIVVAPGHYIIRDTETGKVSYWQREYHQSAADRFGTSTADYIHAMYFFLMQAKAKNVLMIGCGGGTLATMLHRAGVSSTVVDLHQLSFDIAHRYFAMPPDIACHTADGVAWMTSHRQTYDAIILDAFGEQGMPAPFMQPSFFRLAKSRLKRGGLFLMNVIVDDDDDRRPDDMCRALKKDFSRVRLLDTDGWTDRNAVIAAGAVAGLRKPKVLLAPVPGGAKLVRELDILDWRALR